MDPTSFANETDLIICVDYFGVLDLLTRVCAGSQLYLFLSWRGLLFLSSEFHNSFLCGEEDGVRSMQSPEVKGLIPIMLDVCDSGILSRDIRVELLMLKVLEQIAFLIAFCLKLKSCLH